MDQRQCVAIVSRLAKRQCRRGATRGPYCTQHAEKRMESMSHYQKACHTLTHAFPSIDQLYRHTADKKWHIDHTTLVKYIDTFRTDPDKRRQQAALLVHLQKCIPYKQLHQDHYYAIQGEEYKGHESFTLLGDVLLQLIQRQGLSWTQPTPGVPLYTEREHLETHSLTQAMEQMALTSHKPARRRRTRRHREEEEDDKENRHPNVTT
jgi:hypothetical protein